MRRTFALITTAAALIGGCQTTGASQPRERDITAVLQSDDPQNIAALKAVLAQAVGRARIELGPGDLTQTSTISVLPPPLGPNETRSPARPTQFDLVIDRGQCFVIRREDGARFAAEGVGCRPR
ncbi:MAG: hypothetical protein AAFW68_00980 [Pseudomonadota bacterium]